MNKVLIIDDDKELCALIKRSVLSEDIEADFCNTGKEGLQKLKEREYQLVILDVMIGVKDYTCQKWIGAGNKIPDKGTTIKVIYCEDKPSKARIEL